ncbi:MAG: hypothetical protein AAFX93_10680 [Verrucomicrobiota bacterium]
MKRIVLILVLGLALNANAFDFRTWTANDGRTIQAKLIDIQEDSVVVESETTKDLAGKPMIYTVPVSRFSEDDQQYVYNIQRELRFLKEKFDRVKRNFPENLRLAHGSREYSVSEWKVYNQYRKAIDEATIFNLSGQIEEMEFRMENHRRDLRPKASSRGPAGTQAKHDLYFVDNYIEPYLINLKRIETAVEAMVSRANSK